MKKGRAVVFSVILSSLVENQVGPGKQTSGDTKNDLTSRPFDFAGGIDPSDGRYIGI